MHVGSPRKDNAEEVAKRRAAMQRELELRYFVISVLIKGGSILAVLIKSFL